MRPKYKIGRENLSITVIVPDKCENSCPFCTQINNYGSHSDIISTIIELKEAGVRDVSVVITGGEPANNVKDLQNLVKIVDLSFGGDIFINTVYPEKIINGFSREVLSKVLFNVSRHGSVTNKEKYLKGVIADSELVDSDRLSRINVVIEDVDCVEPIIARWNPLLQEQRGVLLNLRKDYTTVTLDSIGELDEVAVKLSTLGRLVNSSGCNVCQTYTFDVGGLFINYHIGVEHSSIRCDDYTEVNDIIINPDGKIKSDWIGGDELSAKTVRELTERAWGVRVDSRVGRSRVLCASQEPRINKVCRSIC